MGQKFLIERSFEEITAKLMKPNLPEGEESLLKTPEQLKSQPDILKSEAGVISQAKSMS